MVDPPTILPEAALEASGHCQRFCDYIAVAAGGKKMKFDEEFVELHFPSSIPRYREIVSQAAGSNPDEAMHQAFVEIVGAQGAFTWGGRQDGMFKFKVGGRQDGTQCFLRPECATSCVLMIKEHLNTGGTIPCALGTVGKAYRNEIAPRGWTKITQFRNDKM